MLKMVGVVIGAILFVSPFVLAVAEIVVILKNN